MDCAAMNSFIAAAVDTMALDSTTMNFTAKLAGWWINIQWYCCELIGGELPWGELRDTIINK